MKTQIHLLLLAASLSAVPVSPLRAQIVNDGATNTLSNVTNTFPGDVTIGTNGSFTLLTLSDNALLTNSVNGVIGRNATAKSNEVRLLSASARWRMGGSLFVGSNGASSRLVVSNGAFVDNNNGILASRIDSSNNFALVTGAGSLWSNRNDLDIGGSGRDNRMIVSNGGWVASRTGDVGENPSASNNLALVTGSGSVWSNALNLRVGALGPSNRLVIEAGGLVHCDSGMVGDFNSASNNEALVTGPDSLWTNQGNLTVGSQIGFNRLVVSNGAAVRSASGVMGSLAAAVSNQVIVTGAGSVWSNRTTLVLGGGSVGNRANVNNGGWLACSDGWVGSGFSGNSNMVTLTGGSGWNNLGGLIVGDGGSGNVLIASNGATVLSSNATIGASTSLGNNNLALLTGEGTFWSNRNNFVVGNFSFGNRLQVDSGATVFANNCFIGANAGSNNRVVVNGGTLRAANASGTGLLDVRRGTNVLNAGLIDTDLLLLTNTAGRFDFNGGTLITRGAVISNGLRFVVGPAGATSAVWHVRAGATNHLVANQLVVGSNSSFNRLFITNGAILDAKEYTFLAFTAGSNNEVVVSGPGSTFNSSFGFFVGADGNANRMLISNGGKAIVNLGNSGTFIGRSVGTRSNAVIVTDPGSRWSVRDSLSVGAGGNANQLVVSNGAMVDSLIGNVGSATNNLALVTGANSSWSNRSELTVGSSGSGNRLVVSDGGTVINSNGYVGFINGSRDNTALVSGAGSLWNNRSDLQVGRDGRTNRLIVSDGGTVMSGNGFLGFSGFSGQNAALVTGAGSLWSNRLDLHVGHECTFNLLVVSNQAQVMNRSGSVGFGAVAGDNGAVVTGAGSVWNNSQDLIVGNASLMGFDNWLLLTNGGAAFAAGNGIIGLDAGSLFGLATVTGPGSRWVMGGDLSVGSNGAFNQLIVANGGVVSNVSGFLGGASSSGDNIAQVIGAGSLWDNRSNLAVGFSGSKNALTVETGGMVVASERVTLGVNVSSTNNRVVVDDGTLRATNAAGTGVLDVRRGTNVLNAGLIEVDQLLLTNAQGFFEFNGGTLSMKNSTFSNGQVFRVGNGVSPATLVLAGNGNHSFSSSGVSVSAKAALTGNGTASGAISVQAGGLLSPGVSIGKIFATRVVSPSLQGAVLMEISKNGSVLTNDLLQVSVFLTYGGSLTVSNLGPTALAAGDRFRLFGANNYFGAFSALTLPNPGPGLNWTNKMLVDGSIEVVAWNGPTIGNVALSGTNLIFSVTDGFPGGAFDVLTATDINTPVTNWAVLRSGTFDWLGNTTVTNGIAPGEPQRFLQIRTP